MTMFPVYLIGFILLLMSWIMWKTGITGSERRVAIYSAIGGIGCFNSWYVALLTYL